MHLKSGTSIVALTCLTLALAPSADARGVRAPPRSDGSSGSFDAQFGNGIADGFALSWWNLDTGEVFINPNGTPQVAFTVPFKTIEWNGQTLHAYNFSKLTVEPTVNLIIYGTTPAVLVSKSDISFAGQFNFQNTNIAGGTPSTGKSGNYDGGPGAGIGGGGGGAGPGGQIETQNCGPTEYSGSGGGGGGNYAMGRPGFESWIPTDAYNPPPPYLGGPGGRKEKSTTLQGGGGGAAGGGGNYAGEYFGGSPGGNGGGAVVFSTRGTITLTSSAVLSTEGGAGGGAGAITGGSGGGAGGDQWFFAGTGFSNAGQILANGGLGSKIRLSKSSCSRTPTVVGPNGGDGSGGVLFISAPSVANSGTINLSGGNGSANPNGGLLDASGVSIDNTGTIVGAAKTE